MPRINTAAVAAIVVVPVVVVLALVLGLIFGLKPKSSAPKLTFAASVNKKENKQFLWGASSSAFQIEGNLTAGGRGDSIWDPFIGNTAIIGSPDLACNSYYQWRDDIDVLKSIGAKAYRFSIAWPRIIPQGSLYAGTSPTPDPSRINQEGIAYYNGIIDACLAAGITPVVTLYHWDLPAQLQRAYNGWLCKESYPFQADSTKIVTDFAKYADVCFRAFGDRVKHWATINEPQTIAVDCYEFNWYAPGNYAGPQYGSYPGTGSPDGVQTNGSDYYAAHQLLLAHAAAYRLYDASYRSTQNGKVGIVCNMDWDEPLTSSPEDAAAAERAHVFWGGWFWDPVFFGDYPQLMKQYVNSRPPLNRLPSFTPDQSKALRGSIDIFFWNTYTTAYVYNSSVPANQVGWTYDQLNGMQGIDTKGLMIGAPTASAWLNIVPWGIGKAIKWIQARYSLPKPPTGTTPASSPQKGIIIYDNEDGTNPRHLQLMITENGMDVLGQGVNTSPEVASNDYQRWHDYFMPYIDTLQKAAEDVGVDFAGYMAWALMDNLEWTHGMTNRFGITYVNFLDDTGKLIPAGGPSVKLPRVIKDSARWLQTFFEKGNK